MKTIIKPNQGLLEKTVVSPENNSVVYKISEVFMTYTLESSANIFPITKFKLTNYDTTVFVGGRKLIDPRLDPSPEYYVDLTNNQIQLLGVVPTNQRVEVTGGISVPSSENEFIFYFEEKLTISKNTFILPWEYDHLNKGISVFVNGNLIPSSGIRCPNHYTVDLIVPPPANATVVILARRLFLSPDLYGTYFSSIPNGVVMYTTGNSVPNGFIKGDRSKYARSDYPIFVQWLISDGNFIDNESLKDLPENLGKYVLSSDGDYFYTPDLLGASLIGTTIPGVYSIVDRNTNGTSIENDYRMGYTPIIRAYGPTGITGGSGGTTSGAVSTLTMNDPGTLNLDIYSDHSIKVVQSSSPLTINVTAVDGLEKIITLIVEPNGQNLTLSWGSSVLWTNNTTPVTNIVNGNQAVFTVWIVAGKGLVTLVDNRAKL